MNTETARIAGVVSQHLRAAGRSQRNIADATGIPIATLSRRLTGRSPFLFTELGLIAQEIDTTVSALVAEAERIAA